MRKFPLMAQTLDFTCGAVSLASVLRRFGYVAADEMQLAEELGTLRAGFTPPENVVAIARAYGYHAEMKTDAGLVELREAAAQSGAMIVTWWDEDAGHYSVVENVAENSITLMDPWLAREGRFNELPLDYFVEKWKSRGARIIRIWERNSLAPLPEVAAIDCES